MDTKKVLDLLIELINSKKGEDILVIDVEEITVVAKYIVIITATSLVHSNSLGKYIINFFEENGFDNLYKKRPDLNNPWVLIDASDIIVNIFLPETRDFYNLDRLYFKGKILYSM